MTLDQSAPGRNTQTGATCESSLELGFKGSEARRFIELLGKDSAQTWLRLLDPLKERKAGADWQGVSLAVGAKAADGFNVYAVIGNTGATIKGRSVTDADITDCPALFVEWDDGATIEEQAQRWQELGLPEPSITVATGGKSVHCYWVLNEPMAPEPWRVLIARLIAHCNSDTQCSNPSRVMRLPGSVYYGKKDSSAPGKPIGRCRVIGTCDARYDAADLEACLPAPAKPKPVAAAPKGEWEPRSIEEINAAAEFIPKRTSGHGTYPEDRNAICGCSAALDEIGHPDPDGAALALLGHLWPSESDAQQVLASTTTRKAGAFWAIAGKHGYNLKRSKKPKAKDAGKATEPGTGNAVRLKPNQVLELLPERVGTLRLNVRSGDVHTDKGVLSANDAGRLYLKLSTAAETWGKEVTADAVAYLANQNRFDPVADFLNDTGTPLPMEQWQRLDQHLLGIDDPIAAEFLPRYFISAVARVFAPGCDVRQSPVLVGPQWRGKTALGRILFGAEHWLSGVGDLGKDALMRLHTAWGVELAELDGVTRRSDQESLKAFLTETVDSIRRPYDVATVRHPRKFVFWGTSNGAALRDATGNTRYVTIAIPDKMLPLEWAEQNRCALWARAVEQYKAGVDWNQCSDEIRDAIADRNANFTEVDPWTDRIAAALKRRALELQVPVQVADLLQVVEVPVERQRTTEGQRVRRIAESLGWVMERRQSGDERRRGLWPPLPQAPQQAPQAATRTESSHCNGSSPAATSATTKTKELERKQQGQPQQHPRKHSSSRRGDTFGAFHMAQVAARPEPLQRSEPEPPAHMAAHMAAHVAPVSTGYISGWIDPAPAPVGSGADAFDDGDDPAWSKRAA